MLCGCCGANVIASYKSTSSHTYNKKCHVISIYRLQILLLESEDEQSHIHIHIWIDMFLYATVHCLMIFTLLEITGTTEYFDKIQNNRYSENWKHFEKLKAFFQNAFNFRSIYCFVFYTLKFVIFKTFLDLIQTKYTWIQYRHFSNTVLANIPFSTF
jgi:hypothetical protein